MVGRRVQAGFTYETPLTALEICDFAVLTMPLQNHFTITDKVHPLGPHTSQEKCGFLSAGQRLAMRQQLLREQLFKS